MRTSSLLLPPLCACILAAARLHHSLVPEDPYAFPKYRVTFLNGLPVLNETAERWLSEGLQGGDLEFMEQPWKDSQGPSQLKRIEGGVESPQPLQAVPHASNFTLERMKLGPRMSYLCLIPPPLEDSAAAVAEEAQPEVTPVHSWSLLQPLTGTCLYHKQGWFTYSYCHNLHVRQFHELPSQQQHRPASEYKPEEDPEWDSYTLGRAPPSLETGADLTVAEEAAVAANLELARGAGSRYLVQRWGDGTYCDKTGKKREIEVQFHCSMTMTDTILFVKETQICHYVLHIATPRLCGVPGFKSRQDAHDEAYVRCREVVSAEEYALADASLPSSDRPVKVPRRAKRIIAPPPPPAPAPDAPEPPAKQGQGSLLRQALERFLAQNGMSGLGASEIVVEPLDDGEDGEFVIEFIEADVILGGEDGGEDEGEVFALDGDRLMEILRAAGYEIKDEKEKGKENADGDAKKRRSQEGGEAGGTTKPVQQRRDEL